MRGPARPAGALLSILVLFLSAVPLHAAVAQGAAQPARDAIYHRRLQAAQAFYREQRYQATIVELQAAYALVPLPRLLFNLGQAHLKLGHAEEALRFYERYERESPALDAQEQRALAAARARALVLAPAPLPPQPVPPSAPSASAPPAGASPAPPAASLVASAGLPVRSPLTQPRATSLTRKQRIAVGVLAGAVVVTLASAATLHGLDGRVGLCHIEQSTYLCTYDLRAGYASAYAAAGILAGGLVLSLTIPERLRLR